MRVWKRTITPVRALVGPNTRFLAKSNTDMPPDWGLIEKVTWPGRVRRTIRPPQEVPDTVKRPLPPRPGTSSPRTRTRRSRPPTLGSRLAWSSPTRMVAGRRADPALAPP